MSSGNNPNSRTTYEANCHCGLVRYSVTLDEPLEATKVVSCNCSICVHNGYLNVYPKREDVVFHSGYDQLKSYRFAHKDRPHKFCPECGSSLLIDFKDIQTFIHMKNHLAINVRHFRNIDLDKLQYEVVPGKTFEPPYESWIDEKRES